MMFSSDASNALEGNLRRFQASPVFVHSILGIPVVLEECTGGGKDTLLNTRLFVAGLSWYRGGAARRREHLPCGTRAGWEDFVQLQRIVEVRAIWQCVAISAGRGRSGFPVVKVLVESWMPEGRRSVTHVLTVWSSRQSC